MEKNLKKNIYIMLYVAITLSYTWNIVNQLYFNEKSNVIVIMTTEL